jgi:hypothetical protein
MHPAKNGEITLAEKEVLEALKDGAVLGDAHAESFIENLLARKLIEQHGDVLHLSDEGLNLYETLRKEVDAVTADLVAEVSEADLETTRRTLATIHERAKHRLR